jgi:hypothetical protein
VGALGGLIEVTRITWAPYRVGPMPSPGQSEVASNLLCGFLPGLPMEPDNDSRAVESGRRVETRD